MQSRLPGGCSSSASTVLLQLFGRHRDLSLQPPWRLPTALFLHNRRSEYRAVLMLLTSLTVVRLFYIGVSKQDAEKPRPAPTARITATSATIHRQGPPGVNRRGPKRRASPKAAKPVNDGADDKSSDTS